MSLGSTPLSTTSIGAGQIPASGLYTEGHAGANMVVPRGGRNHTDGNAIESAASEVFVADLPGTGAAITAATSFSGVPSVGQLVVNSYVTLANPGAMSTFLAELQTSAFVGTLSFYGLEPDGSKLQLISGHLRGASTIASSVALSVVAATNEVWAGSIAGFSAIYVVCTAFTSGSITVTPALSAAVYAVSITNTVNTLDTNSAGMKSDLDTLAGIVSSSKAAVKAGAGDITDLATLAGAIASSRMQVDISRVLGAALSASNPNITEAAVQNAIRQGQAYSCSTGLVSAAANQAASFFVPNTSAKTVVIWSVRMMYSNASQVNDFRYLTADDSNIVAGTSDAGNVVNMKFGGGAPASGFAMHHVAAVTAPGASASNQYLDEILNAVNTNTELLSPGMYIVVPAGTAGGLAVYSGTTASGKWAVTVRFLEL